MLYFVLSSSARDVSNLRSYALVKCNHSPLYHGMVETKEGI